MALQHSQACHVILDLCQQVFGDNANSIQEKRTQVNLDSALYSNHLHDLKGAIAYMNEAVQVKPVAARVQFYRARYLFLDEQYTTMIPLLQHLILNHEQELSRRNYYETLYMLVTSLDKEKRHVEAKELFFAVNMKKKSTEEVLHLRYAFYLDYPYVKKIKPTPDNTEFRFFEYKMMYADYDREFADDQDISSLPRRLIVANLERMKIGATNEKLNDKVVDACTNLLRYDDPENSFTHFVHRALAYFGMKQYHLAYQDCTSAMEHVNNRTDLFRVCSALWASVSDVTFLSTSALIDLYPRDNKSKQP